MPSGQRARPEFGAPSATITSPAAGGNYKQGQVVPAGFSCLDAPYGPGIASCTDALGRSGGVGQLPTSTAGSETCVVTATSCRRRGQLQR